MEDCIEYVQDQYAKKAREMEEVLAKLPPEAGIVFVSVKALPDKFGQSKGYTVTVGVSRKFDPATGIAIAKRVLADYVLGSSSLLVNAFCGSPGSCRDPS